MMKPIHLFTLILFLTTSCALKPIKPNNFFVKEKMGNVELNELGNGKVLIYNGANILHKLDNTARLNFWINDKAVGQLKPSEYIIINLTPDNNYNFKLLHVDLFKFHSQHSEVIDSDTKVIMIKPTAVSNKLEIKNILPKKFKKFDCANI